MQIYTVLALLSVVIAVSATPQKKYGQTSSTTTTTPYGYGKPASSTTETETPYGYGKPASSTTETETPYGYGKSASSTTGTPSGYGKSASSTTGTPYGYGKSASSTTGTPYGYGKSASSSTTEPPYGYPVSSSTTEVIVIPSLPEAPECRRLHGCKKLRSETKKWFKKHLHHLKVKFLCKWENFISGLLEFKHAIGSDLNATFRKIHCTERQFVYWWKHYQDLRKIKRAGRLHYQAEFFAWYELLIKNDTGTYLELKKKYKLEADYAGDACDEHGCEPQEPTCEISSDHCQTPCVTPDCSSSTETPCEGPSCPSSTETPCEGPGCGKKY